MANTIPPIIIDHQKWETERSFAKDQAAGVNKSVPQKYSYEEDLI